MRIAMLLHKSVEFDSRVRREARALVAAGHEVTVLELADVPSPAARVADGFDRRSCRPVAWVHRLLPFHLYRLAFLWCFVRGLVAIRPNVVHAHDAAMLLPGFAGARLTGARLVYDSHELATGVPYRDRLWARFVAALEWLIVPRCLAVITVSDGIADRLAQRYRLPATPTVIRNVSDLEQAGAGGLRRALGIGLDVPLILHQGSPAPDRGCEVLIEALRDVDGAFLAFLGDGEPAFVEQLRELARARGVAERVRLLPSVALDQLLAWTAEADLGVTLLQDTCENHRLALPNKLFEYIAARVPVLAGALPEVRLVVEGAGVGWCVAPEDPAAVALGLRRGLDARDDPRLAERLEHAARRLCWDVEQERLVALYAGFGEEHASRAVTSRWLRSGGARTSTP